MLLAEIVKFNFPFIKTFFFEKPFLRRAGHPGTLQQIVGEHSELK